MKASRELSGMGDSQRDSRESKERKRAPKKEEKKHKHKGTKYKK